MGFGIFSLLEVNRYIPHLLSFHVEVIMILKYIHRSISGVRGFIRETLIAIVANTELREWRKQYCTGNNIPIEHPRASTTDDVECFFSVFCDTVGKDHTLKEVLVTHN